MRYRYAYQNSGHPILSWKDGPPRQTKAADCQSLGSLGDDTLGIGVLPLAVPGGPEPVGDCGRQDPCSKGRPHTHPSGPLGVDVSTYSSSPPAPSSSPLLKAALLGGAAYLAYRFLLKK